jgi:hypothetical protein
MVAKMVSIDDVAIRPACALADGEELSLGRHVVRWIDTPHFPHAWECGHLFAITTGTLFCGDLFTQGGNVHPPITSTDSLSQAKPCAQQWITSRRHATHASYPKSSLQRRHACWRACMDPPGREMALICFASSALGWPISSFGARPYRRNMDSVYAVSVESTL